MFFERGYVEIDGWIPERVHGRVDAPAAALEALVRPLCPLLEVREDSGAVSFDVRFADRQAAYRSAIVDGMRDLIAKHRGPSHRMVVSAHDARDSLALALGAQRAVVTGGRERLSADRGVSGSETQHEEQQATKAADLIDDRRRANEGRRS
jgi:hypothetical protein